MWKWAHPGVATQPHDVPLSPMPKVHKLKSKAVATDIASFGNALVKGHRDGVNVLFGDGSARFARKNKTIDEYLKIIGGGGANATTRDGFRAIFDLLDRE
jgi:prepilin-type processing-associated H-X9-DG protein